MEAARDGGGSAGRPLSELLPALTDAGAGSTGGADPRITAITTSSDEVEPGALFVAIRGTSTDGHAYLGEAVRRGAAAVVIDRAHSRGGEAGDADVPAIRVEDTRRAAAELAAAWYGHPARALRLVGITGSIGKTSILSMIEAILAEAGIHAGAVGSLGVHVDGQPRSDTGHTAPGPLLLQRELARIAGEGCELAAMEVTSHALVQERVHGLAFDLGVFTNLVPLEHSEYHDSFRDYANAKRRFFSHLKSCVPLVFNVDNQVVRRLVHESDAEPVGVGSGRAALVRIGPYEMDVTGSRFELEVRRPVPRIDGGETDTGTFPLQLRLLGYSNITNAALAAATGLCLGVEPDVIAAALAALPRQPRRLEVIHSGRFLVLDDTVGHPDSISALFQVVQRFEPRRVHVAFAVRGQRGPQVNRHTAEALAIWAQQLPIGRLVVTHSTEAADERNRVEPEEARAVTEALERHGVDHRVTRRLDEAVEAVLDAAGEGDLVVLAGAQGMDGGRLVVERSAAG